MRLQLFNNNNIFIDLEEINNYDIIFMTKSQNDIFNQ